MACLSSDTTAREMRAPALWPADRVWRFRSFERGTRRNAEKRLEIF